MLFDESRDVTKTKGSLCDVWLIIFSLKQKVKQLKRNRNLRVFILENMQLVTNWM